MFMKLKIILFFLIELRGTRLSESFIRNGRESCTFQFIGKKAEYLDYKKLGEIAESKSA